MPSLDNIHKLSRHRLDACGPVQACILFLKLKVDSSCAEGTHDLLAARQMLRRQKGRMTRRQPIVIMI